MNNCNIEVFISLGGWDGSCNPYFYMKNSIGRFTVSPNTWKIEDYGKGSTDNCVPKN